MGIILCMAKEGIPRIYSNKRPLALQFRSPKMTFSRQNVGKYTKISMF